MNTLQRNQLAVLLVLLTGSQALFAQDIISKRTETQSMTIAPIGAGTQVRDLPTAALPASEMPAGVRPAPRSTVNSELRTTYTEVEVYTLAFQIPNFDPADRQFYQYHVGMFSETGNGNGTAYPDEQGYVQFEMTRHQGQELMQTYLYGVHVETGEVEAFIDIPNVTVNKAVDVINNLARRRATFDRRTVSQRLMQYFPPPQQGNERSTGLYGNYLTIDDLIQQVYDQTGCWVEQDDLGVFYLDYCQ